MSESKHFVRHILPPGDYVRTEYQCRAPEDAPCRSLCTLCDAEDRDRCECECLDELGTSREPVLAHGMSCNYVAWLDDDTEPGHLGNAGEVVR